MSHRLEETVMSVTNKKRSFSTTFSLQTSMCVFLFKDTTVEKSLLMIFLLIYLRYFSILYTTKPNPTVYKQYIYK